MKFCEITLLTAAILALGSCKPQPVDSAFDRAYKDLSPGMTVEQIEQYLDDNEVGYVKRASSLDIKRLKEEGYSEEELEMAEMFMYNLEGGDNEQLSVHFSVTNKVIRVIRLKSKN